MTMKQEIANLNIQLITANEAIKRQAQGLEDRVLIRTNDLNVKLLAAQERAYNLKRKEECMTTTMTRMEDWLTRRGKHIIKLEELLEIYLQRDVDR
jgi:hypothetical protein